MHKFVSYCVVQSAYKPTLEALYFFSAKRYFTSKNAMRNEGKPYAGKASFSTC